MKCIIAHSCSPNNFRSPKNNLKWEFIILKILWARPNRFLNLCTETSCGRWLPASSILVWTHINHRTEALLSHGSIPKNTWSAKIISDRTGSWTSPKFLPINLQGTVWPRIPFNLPKKPLGSLSLQIPHNRAYILEFSGKKSALPFFSEHIYPISSNIYQHVIRAMENATFVFNLVTMIMSLWLMFYYPIK